MTLNEKIKYIEDNNYIKGNLNLYYALISIYSFLFSGCLFLIIFFSKPVKLFISSYEQN